MRYKFLVISFQDKSILHIVMMLYTTIYIMHKSVVCCFLATALVSIIFTVPSYGQKKVKPKRAVRLGAPSTMLPSVPEVPKGPTYIAIDDPPLVDPITLNVKELKFGSQGVGVESCMYVTITNTSGGAQAMTRLSIDDGKRYSIPSPSQQMLPISIQPKSNLTIGVCFKPEKVGEFKTRLVITTAQDSVVIPVEGKGIKPEDVGKLPKTEFSVSKKKKHEWNIKLRLVSPAKINLQLFDDLGVSKFTFLNNDFKNEGLYEIPFDGLDKDKKKIPEGKYYLRCVIEEPGRGTQATKFTKGIEIE